MSKEQTVPANVREQIESVYKYNDDDCLDLSDRVMLDSLKTAAMYGAEIALENQWVPITLKTLPMVTVEDIVNNSGMIAKYVIVANHEEMMISIVGDHNVWYYQQIEQGFTHYMELPTPPNK